MFKVETPMVPGIRRLEVRGANTDDTYEHTVYIGVVVDATTPKPTLLERAAAFFVPPEVLEE